MKKKFQIEKFLHEIIRDLPDAYDANTAFEYGMTTADECLRMIMDAYHKAQKDAKA